MALSASNLKVGDTHEEVVAENLSRGLLVMYAGTSGDYNPLHTDEVYTKEVAGYPSVFAHGMLTMGLTGKMLTNYVGDGRLKKYRRPLHQPGVARRHADIEGDRRRNSGRRMRHRSRDDEPGRQNRRHGQCDSARRLTPQLFYE